MSEKLTSPADWSRVEKYLWENYACINHEERRITIDDEVVRIIRNMGAMVKELSILQIELKHGHKRKYNEALDKFNSNLDDMEQLMMIRVMMR